MNMKTVLGLILGGGRGSRLYPLTRVRANPAVPLVGKYRLIDIPISNCLHAGINKIAILTQFNSVSLHRHIQKTYARDMFTNGWVQILAAEQTQHGSGWYQGTADAVRRQIGEIESAGTDYVLILAGDHLSDIDYAAFVQYHVESSADITMAVQPVSPDVAPALGILKRDDDGRIVSFTEKPDATALAGLESTPGTEKPYLASMGIYVFRTDLLLKVLQSEGDDFGKSIIPNAISDSRVMGYVYDGYWADIGTIRAFYEINLAMARPDRPFDFYTPGRPIYTRPRFLPASEIQNSTLHHALVADGCRVQSATIQEAVIGLRSLIGPNVTIRSSILMGAHSYETDQDRSRNRELGRPDMGIGEGSTIECAIIDKNARIGRNVRIRAIPDRPDSQTESWVIREGVVVIPKGAIIPDGTEI